MTVPGDERHFLIDDRVFSTGALELAPVLMRVAWRAQALKFDAFARKVYSFALVDRGVDNSKFVSLFVIPGTSRIFLSTASNSVRLEALSSTKRSQRPFVV
jgi:hypothetical protein